jgi:hypothetical protein
MRVCRLKEVSAWSDSVMTVFSPADISTGKLDDISVVAAQCKRRKG